MSGDLFFAGVPTQWDYLGCLLCPLAPIHVQAAQNIAQAAAWQRARWALARNRCRYSQGSPQKKPNSSSAFCDGSTSIFAFRSANQILRTSNGGDTTINNEVAPRKVM